VLYVLLVFKMTLFLIRALGSLIFLSFDSDHIIGVTGRTPEHAASGAWQREQHCCFEG
jgi:hypothetical protein